METAKAGQGFLQTMRKAQTSRLRNRTTGWASSAPLRNITICPDRDAFLDVPFCHHLLFAFILLFRRCRSNKQPVQEEKQNPQGKELKCLKCSNTLKDICLCSYFQTYTSDMHPQ